MTPVTLTIQTLWCITDPVFVELKRAYFDGRPFYVEGTPFQVVQFERFGTLDEQFMEVKATLMKDAEAENRTKLYAAAHDLVTCLAALVEAIKPFHSWWKNEELIQKSEAVLKRIGYKENEGAES